MRELAQGIVSSLPAIDAAVLGCLLAMKLAGNPTHHFTSGNLLVLLLLIPLTNYLLGSFGLYDSHRVEPPLQIARNVLFAHACAAVVGSALLYPASPDMAIGILPVFGIASILLAAMKTAVHTGLRVARRHGMDQRTVLLVGSWEQAVRFEEHLKAKPEWGLRLACVLSSCAVEKSEPVQCFSYPDRHTLDTNIEDLLRTQVIDEVLVPVALDAPICLFEEARRFAPYGLQVRVMFEPASDTRLSAGAEAFEGSASVQVGPSGLDGRSRALKRIIDLAGASLLLLLAFPLMLAIAILIRLSSPGPVLFRQTRAGLNGRHFRMLKFRTMVNGAELQVQHLHRSITRSHVFKDVHDYRVTPLGKILRRFSLDELPQFLNILRGEMSLVGPRPLPLSEANQVSGEYRRRFSVPPGLTCIWQVSGRSQIPYDSWMRYDLQYVDQQSLWVDTVLLVRTIPAVLTGRGAF